MEEPPHGSRCGGGLDRFAQAPGLDPRDVPGAGHSPADEAREVRRTVAEPALLLHRGRFLDAALRAERVTREEVLAVLRSNGVDDPAGVAAVVLETDGSLSVLKGQEGKVANHTLANVKRLPVLDHPNPSP